MGTQRIRPERPCVLILTPVYNEEAGLPEYQRRVSQTLLERQDANFRVLFIEDGSKDKSWEIIQDICRQDSRFSGIRLSRNFGSHIALTAGFAHAGPETDALATLACDLQDPPEVVLEFLERWREGFQIVWGKRRSRADEAWRTWSSGLLHVLLRKFALPNGSKFTTGSFLLVDKQVAKCFKSFHETNRITFALVAWTGFNQAVVEYDRMPRATGRSGWSIWQMFKSMYDAFLGFSSMPVRLISLMGFGTFLLTFFLLLYLLVCWVLGHPTPGWTSLMFTMGLFFGLQFFLTSILGEYLYRIYTEVVRRPLFFVSESTGDLDDR